MNGSRLLLTVTITFWMFIVVLIARTQMIGTRSITLHWHNLSQPTTTFHWTKTPETRPVRLGANESRTFNITVPRAFDRALLLITSTPGDGVVTAVVNTKNASTLQTATTTAGQVLTVPITWQDTAVATRSFSVRLSAATAAIELQTISLTLVRP